jgi:uncharacterized membrane protein YagU involved in acid resistance
MTMPAFSRNEAIFWGGLVAGFVDMMTIFVIWSIFKYIPPALILQAITSALMGDAAYQGGYMTVAIGLALHFFVSFCFAAAYVLASGRVSIMRTHPFLCGPIYGIIAYVFMTYVVVPLSLANFGRPATLPDLALSLSIHMFVFGLAIAWVASRIRRN